MIEFKKIKTISETKTKLQGIPRKIDLNEYLIRDTKEKEAKKNQFTYRVCKIINENFLEIKDLYL